MDSIVIALEPEVEEFAELCQVRKTVDQHNRNNGQGHYVRAKCPP